MKNEWGDVRSGLDAYDLTGKQALVIGAGGPAGRAIALALGEAGADVTVSSTSNDGDEIMRAKKVQQELTKMGRKSATVATDVTLGTGVQVMVRQVAKDMGRIDILVNAPDVFLGKPADATTDMEWNRVMQVNLSGTFHACRAAGKEMLKQRAGRIINVASVLGERGLANAAAYCAAQAGILNLTRALAQEWGPSGITVNAIAQGWMEYSAAIGNPDPAANQTVRFIPMKRAGAPDELASLAVYLASDSCGYISGQVMAVDGGLTTHL
ncbi:MAG TPA: SDR family oxidoreductase [Dehalococcoidia bacterium]|jgi:NAD(P)-dependent dehydrogenase (short-subunit alcohol dehydrogenase family)